MASDPTGERFRIRTSGVEAEIAQVGAALRALTVGGVDLVPRYPDDTPAPAASGTVLVPWPGRVRDGRWTQRGVTRRLAITEPALGNASHGLLRFAAYRVETASEAALTLRADVFPQTGYPFHLENRVTYTVVADGLRVRHDLVNAGNEEAPFAVGAHPYVFLGDVALEDCVLRASGATRIVTDARNLPEATLPVDAATDLRAGRRVGDVDLDTAYTDLTRDADGSARTTLTAPDGRVLTLWQDSAFAWTQVFTTDRYPGLAKALAVEPMTAPADALNSGSGLSWLAPGDRFAAEWGIALAAS
jgi:aldose 1-epimerase